LLETGVERVEGQRAAVVGPGGGKVAAASLEVAQHPKGGRVVRLQRQRVVELAKGGGGTAYGNEA
jgi:hypothetical protein